MDRVLISEFKARCIELIKRVCTPRALIDGDAVGIGSHEGNWQVYVAQFSQLNPGTRGPR